MKNIVFSTEHRCQKKQISLSHLTVRLALLSNYIDIANRIRASRPPIASAPADYPRLMQAEHDVPIEPDTTPPILIAASEKKKSALELYNEEKPLPDPGGVVIEEFDTDALEGLKKVMPKPLTKADVEQAVFSGTYRAFAKFKTPEGETEIDTVDRLYKEGEQWKRIVHQVYYPDIEIDEIPDIDSEVKRIQKMHKRAFPESYEKRTK